MNKRNRVSVLAIAAICGVAAVVSVGPTRAQDAPQQAVAAPVVNNAVSLNDALALAYTKNPTLAAERDNLRKTDEQLSQAYGTALPTLNLQASYTRNDNETEGISFRNVNGNFAPVVGTSSEVTKPKVYSATLTQPVFTGGRTLNAVRQVKALVDVGSAGLSNLEQSILLGTVSVYMEVLTNRQVVSLNETNVTVLRRQLEAAQDRFDVGEITRTDVSQAEARLSGVESQLISARARLMASEAALARLTGVRSADLIVPSSQPRLPATLDEAIGVALSNHPSIYQAEALVRAAKAAKDVAFGEFLPTVSVQAQYKRVDDGSSLQDRSTDKSISAVASWPIFQGFTTVSKNRQASHDIARAHNQSIEARLSVEENVTNAWNDLASARSGIKSSASQVRANEVAVDGVRQEADVGVRTTLDVLNAEQELLDARVTLARARQAETNAAYNLLAACGLLNANELGLNVAVVDPAAPDGLIDKVVDTFLAD